MTAPERAPTSTSTALLDAHEITKRFAGIRALDRVDLSVSTGELVGLIGPNGAGKTTFFNCIYGITPPDDGRVRFAGSDITRIATHRRARMGLARTFQRMELFGGMSVIDHLVVASQARSRRLNVVRDLVGGGRPTATELDAAHELLGLLGLEDDADRPIESLTLGQGRLVELGRALMTEPRLLLLDEPSSGLDRRETDEVAEVLTAARDERGVAILLVEHDLAMVRRVTDRLYVLDYGTLLTSGPTEQVLADPAVRKAYLGVSA
jgi:branched-chain amino acid transport system ATP-binding protein